MEETWTCHNNRRLHVRENWIRKNIQLDIINFYGEKIIIEIVFKRRDKKVFFLSFVLLNWDVLRDAVQVRTHSARHSHLNKSVELLTKLWCDVDMIFILHLSTMLSFNENRALLTDLRRGEIIVQTFVGKRLERLKNRFWGFERIPWMCSHR